MGLSPGSFDSRHLSKKHQKYFSIIRKKLRGIARTDIGYINAVGTGARVQLIGFTSNWQMIRHDLGIGYESNHVGDLHLSELKESDLFTFVFYKTEDIPYVSRNLWNVVRELQMDFHNKNLEKRVAVGCGSRYR